ncbi:phosphoribosylformylglycinamidine synthase subunit PurS [Candidatus Bathyarchaeota archaeon]|nr:phosphoribosylformylglycinamidine synthase subunit PurS [Candidatus Bathyarchaeota archaeon]
MSKVWSICVSYRDEEFDPLGRRTAWEIQDMGISGVGGVKTVQVFQLVGRLDEGEVRMLCEELLHDPIIQQYSYIEGIDASPLFKASNTWSVEVKLQRVQNICSFSKTVIACRHKVMDRGLNPNVLASEAEKHGRTAMVVDDVKEAVKEALKITSNDDVIVVTGSVFTVGEARELWFNKVSLIGREFNESI